MKEHGTASRFASLREIKIRQSVRGIDARDPLGLTRVPFGAKGLDKAEADGPSL